MGILGPNGAVGKELIAQLEKRAFPVQELRLFDSRAPLRFEGLDFLFCCIGSESAKMLIPKGVEAGAICIDASSAYRKEESVPLVIPEINPHALKKHQGIIASPNCTTTLMLLPLAPLHQRFQIKRIVAATYQAVSGAGAKGIEELERQVSGEGVPSVFPHRCAFNTFLHESPLLDSGYVEEEEKMAFETKKILEDPSIGVSARCVRVPVYRAHSEALNVEFHRPFSLEEVEEILAQAPGIAHAESPSAIDAERRNTVLYGKVRLDATQPKTLEMWVVGDQLLKGAALNMVQIAESLCSN